MRTLILVALLAAGPALAHASVTKVAPAENATVSAPKEVRLTFSEAVNPRFSIFKVYALNATGSALTLDRAADALVAAKLRVRNDATARADAGSQSARPTRSVVLPLKANLKPGWYVVMWSLASEDSHPVEGRSLFRVR